MPPLVEPPPFIPPPQGATNGGQPGVYAAGGNRDAGYGRCLFLRLDTDPYILSVQIAHLHGLEAGLLGRFHPMNPRIALRHGHMALILLGRHLLLLFNLLLGVKPPLRGDLVHPLVPGVLHLLQDLGAHKPLLRIPLGFPHSSSSTG